MDRELYREFIELSADLMDEHGLPHTAGRVIGALLVCVPPHMSLDELAEDVGASKGAVSMATQMMVRLGILERISLPGERRHYYRLPENILEDMMTGEREHLRMHQRVFEKGIDLLANEPIEAKMRLIELQAYMDFILGEMPGLSERWAEQRDDLIQQRIKELQKR